MRRPQVQTMTKLRKWSATEDKLLLSSVNTYLAAGTCPDYRTISKRIPDRSPKQCRERYENSLQPDVKRGEWSLEETILLASIMTQHGQNWAAIKERLTNRTYNAIKKKGRKILGEIIDRNCIPKGSKTKASTNWTQEEFLTLLELHLDSRVSEEKRQDYLFLSLNLRTGRSEAEIERQLLQNCNCDTCSSAFREVLLQDCEVSHDDRLAFKEKWSLWKAEQVLQSLHERKTESPAFSRIRRFSSSSTTSCSSASKRRRTAKQEPRLVLEEEDTISNSDVSISTVSSVMSDLPTIESAFFGIDPAELWLNLRSIQHVTERQPLNQLSCTPLSNFAGDASLKEFDLSFLLAQSSPIVQ